MALNFDAAPLDAAGLVGRPAESGASAQPQPQPQPQPPAGTVKVGGRTVTTRSVASHVPRTVEVVRPREMRRHPDA